MRATPATLPTRLQNLTAHLRIRYSLLLAPPFLLVWSLARPAQAWSSEAFLCFLALQMGLYPASQALNSVYDRDEGPIGGLASPPPLDPWLLPLAQILDLLAISLLTWLDFGAGALALTYSLASRAYSHPKWRLKAHPWLGWGVVSFFQGPVVLWITARCLLKADPSPLEHLPHLTALAALFFVGSYPLTQIYQHQEDAARGDLTLSRVLGVRGTFDWWLLWTALTALAFGAFFIIDLSAPVALLAFGGALFPSLIHTLRWRARCLRGPHLPPSHQEAMRGAWLASIGTCTFLILLGLSRTGSIAHFLP